MANRRNPVEQFDATIELLFDSLDEWAERVDRFIATGSDDDDVVVTHDGHGRLIELSVRPGLQRDLTVRELEDAINDALAANADRASEGLAKITREFVAQFARAPYDAVAKHPVAHQLAQALQTNGRAR